MIQAHLYFDLNNTNKEKGVVSINVEKHLNSRPIWNVVLLFNAMPASYFILGFRSLLNKSLHVLCSISPNVAFNKVQTKLSGL